MKKTNDLKLKYTIVRLLPLTNAHRLDKMYRVNRIPIYAKELALAFLPGHRNVRTMRESNFSGFVAKGVWVPMGAIIFTHMLTSLNNLLFTCGEE